MSDPLNQMVLTIYLAIFSPILTYKRGIWLELSLSEKSNRIVCFKVFSVSEKTKFFQRLD
jgi:hypothetical protein